MKPIKQEDDFGCAVACVAYVLGIEYQAALKLFKNGKKRAKEIPNFYCRELVEILNFRGNNYQYKFIKPKFKNKIYIEKSVVYVKRSTRYKYGHYLVRSNNLWMDPWVNFPNRGIRAGFRKRLQGKASYVVYK